jgi:ABC-type lipoprotein release transport system permease subunit
VLAMASIAVFAIIVIGYRVVSGCEPLIGYILGAPIFALIGFVPGVVLSMGLYHLLATVTKLAIYMTVTRALQILLLTFIMCVGSGILATRKLVQLDPADVF